MFKSQDIDEKLVRRWSTRRGVAEMVSLASKGWVGIRRQGNFTTVSVYSKDSGLIGWGMSKRNPRDDENPEVGINVAVWRALDDWLDVQLAKGA